MIWNRDVVLALGERCETNMATALTGDPITETLEGPREVAAREISVVSRSEDFLSNVMKPNHRRPV
jgi:hypothetical protein